MEQLICDRLRDKLNRLKLNRAVSIEVDPYVKTKKSRV